MKDLFGYRYIIGYGIGQYYEYIKTQLPAGFHLDYLCDAKWEQIGTEYDGIQVISPEQLAMLNNVFVVVFSGNKRNYDSISNMLKKMHLPFAHAEEIFQITTTVTGKQLKQQANGVYEDARGNRIKYAEDIEDTVTIHFLGNGSRVEISSCVSVEQLNIVCGENASVRIDTGTEIEGLTIYGTGGEISIGKDCLISYQVIIRNHDVHHIFDRNTGKRINYPGNIQIGDHVWIGYGATLLGNASIGANSVVGTMAVTSSIFPKEVVIAGSPAKIIREHVCWSKDNTNYYDRDHFRECLAKEAMRYF